jgi:hypothetical protein
MIYIAYLLVTGPMLLTRFCGERPPLRLPLNLVLASHAFESPSPAVPDTAAQPAPASGGSE